jgi:geranylgeranyl diphosphate synthase type II
MQLFTQTSIDVCEGQQLDMDYETRNDVTIEEYIHMIALKTSVLLGCALEMGALLGGATGGNAKKLYEFGKSMGIAFQLQDDYLDAFGAADKVGKKIGGDILANKKTFLLLNAIEKADGRQKAAIEQLMRSDDPEKVDQMLTIYRETGTDRDCKTLIDRHAACAMVWLEDVAVTSIRKKHLSDLAVLLLNREA